MRERKHLFLSLSGTICCSESKRRARLQAIQINFNQSRGSLGSWPKRCKRLNKSKCKCKCVSFKPKIFDSLLSFIYITFVTYHMSFSFFFLSFFFFHSYWLFRTKMNIVNLKKKKSSCEGGKLLQQQHVY